MTTATVTFKDLADKAASYIFGDEEPDKGEMRLFSGGDVVGWDYRDFRFVEQNPNTNSDSAERARNGAKILWVFRTGNKGYYAKWEDGKLEMIESNKEDNMSNRVNVGIDDIRKVDMEGSIEAFADIQYGDLVIKGYRVMKNKDGGIFVSPPSHSDDDGNYYPDVFSKNGPRSETNTLINNAILMAFKDEE